MNKSRLPSTLRINRKDIQDLNDRANLIKIINSRENALKKRKELSDEYEEIMKRLFKAQQKKKAKLRAGRGGIRGGRSREIRETERYKRGERRKEGTEEPEIIGEEVKKDAMGNLQITYRDYEAEARAKAQVDAQKILDIQRLDDIRRQDIQLRIDDKARDRQDLELRNNERLSMEREFRNRDDQWRQLKFNRDREKVQYDRTIEEKKLEYLETQMRQGQQFNQALFNLDANLNRRFDIAEDRMRNLMQTNPNSIELVDLTNQNPDLMDRVSSRSSLSTPTSSVLEGMKRDAETDEINRRYDAGEITEEEYTRSLIEMKIGELEEEEEIEGAIYPDEPEERREPLRSDYPSTLSPMVAEEPSVEPKLYSVSEPGFVDVSGEPPTAPHPVTPEVSRIEEINRSYEAGEITEDEYERKLIEEGLSPTSSASSATIIKYYEKKEKIEKEKIEKEAAKFEPEPQPEPVLQQGMELPDIASLIAPDKPMVAGAGSGLETPLFRELLAIAEGISPIAEAEATGDEPPVARIYTEDLKPHAEIRQPKGKARSYKEDLEIIGQHMIIPEQGTPERVVFDNSLVKGDFSSFDEDLSNLLKSKRETRAQVLQTEIDGDQLVIDDLKEEIERGKKDVLEQRLEVLKRVGAGRIEGAGPSLSARAPVLPPLTRPMGHIGLAGPELQKLREGTPSPVTPVREPGWVEIEEEPDEPEPETKKEKELAQGMGLPDIASLIAPDEPAAVVKHGRRQGEPKKEAKHILDPARRRRRRERERADAAAREAERLMQEADVAVPLAGATDLDSLVAKHPELKKFLTDPYPHSPEPRLPMRKNKEIIEILKDSPEDLLLYDKLRQETKTRRELGEVSSPSIAPPQQAVAPPQQAVAPTAHKYTKDQEVMYWSAGNKGQMSWRPAKVVEYRAETGDEPELTVQRTSGSKHDKKTSSETVLDRVVPVPSADVIEEQMDFRNQLKGAIDWHPDHPTTPQWEGYKKFIMHNNTEQEWRGIPPLGQSRLTGHKPKHHPTHKDYDATKENTYYHQPITIPMDYRNMNIGPKNLEADIKGGLISLEKLEEEWEEPDEAGSKESFET